VSLGDAVAALNGVSVSVGVTVLDGDGVTLGVADDVGDGVSVGLSVGSGVFVGESVGGGAVVGSVGGEVGGGGAAVVGGGGGSPVGVRVGIVQSPPCCSGIAHVAGNDVNTPKTSSSRLPAKIQLRFMISSKNSRIYGMIGSKIRFNPFNPLTKNFTR
jgi:hypothetical protein